MPAHILSHALMVGDAVCMECSEWVLRVWNASGGVPIAQPSMNIYRSAALMNVSLVIMSSVAPGDHGVADDCIRFQSGGLKPCFERAKQSRLTASIRAEASHTHITDEHFPGWP
jgi:hypothetical protein